MVWGVRGAVTVRMGISTSAPVDAKVLEVNCNTYYKLLSILSPPIISLTVVAFSMIPLQFHGETDIASITAESNFSLCEVD